MSSKLMSRASMLGVALVGLFCLFGSERLCAGERNDGKLILVTLDGVRGEELFGGIDLTVMKHFASTKDAELSSLNTYKEFWAETAEERRRKLMPFFWTDLMVNHGSVIGNEALGSGMKLKNRWRVSYPGYSEMLTGVADDKRIKGNDPIYNPNPTVLEGLLEKRGLGFHQVAVFASWDVMGFIAQRQENTIFTNSGFQHYESTDTLTASLSKLQFETRTPWDSVRSDAYTFRFAMDYLRRYQPEVIYIALGETDDWAHEKRYDRVLESLHQADEYLRQLWRWIESQDAYAGKTSLLITTDHGRGGTPFTWQSHNGNLPGARSTWLAVVSPNVSKRGEWRHCGRVTTSQVAATFARLGGIDFAEVNPEADRPVGFLFGE